MSGRPICSAHIEPGQRGFAELFLKKSCESSINAVCAGEVYAEGDITKEAKDLGLFYLPCSSITCMLSNIFFLCYCRMILFLFSLVHRSLGEGNVRTTLLTFVEIPFNFNVSGAIMFECFVFS